MGAGRPGTATQWCLIKLGAAGALLVTRDADSPLRQNSLKVRFNLYRS